MFRASRIVIASSLVGLSSFNPLSFKASECSGSWPFEAHVSHYYYLF